MRKNIERVVNAFLNRQAFAEKTLCTDGDVVRSYDIPIAQRLPDGRIEVLPRDAGPTATTKGHIGGVFLGVALAGYVPVQVAQLTGRKPHVFRDRAGDEGYLSRSRPLRSGPTLIDIRAAAAAKAFRRRGSAK